MIAVLFVAIKNLKTLIITVYNTKKGAENFFSTPFF
jgi:hypothetical protein